MLDQCEINDNTANSGAAIEIARQGAIAGGDVVPTTVYVKNSIIARNSVIDLGAAFNMASCQQVVFQNVQFVNNSGKQPAAACCTLPQCSQLASGWQHDAGQNGGAGYCQGDGDPTSLGLSIYTSTFQAGCPAALQQLPGCCQGTLDALHSLPVRSLREAGLPAGQLGQSGWGAVHRHAVQRDCAWGTVQRQPG